jgi:clan AA aspartic protease (TIGR02281 family)
MQSEAWDIVERFAEPLLQFEPDNERFLLILAEAYAQRQEASLMEQTFSRVTYREDLDDEFKRIRSLIRYRTPVKPIESEPRENTNRGIALVQTGSHYIVRAFLDNRSELDLLIDTGASTTAISQQRFRRLYKKHRPELIGRFPINTANGQVNAPIFRFSSLTIDEFQVNNFAVIVLPDRSNLDSDGLLGMNFLRHYDFRIDQRSSELFLQKR